MFDTLGMAINGLRTRIDITLLEDRQRKWMSDSQNSLREFYKTDVISMSASLSKNLKELKEELIVEWIWLNEWGPAFPEISNLYVPILNDQQDKAVWSLGMDSHDTLFFNGNMLLMYWMSVKDKGYMKGLKQKCDALPSLPLDLSSEDVSTRWI
ncbi:hypothetical protein Tco_1510068 [Tanacetum coccineum]